MPICVCVWCPVHQPLCACAPCPVHQPACTCTWCPVHPLVSQGPVTHPQGTLPIPLTPNLGEVQDIYSPRRSNGRHQGDEVAVEERWSGYMEASDSASEPIASTSHYVDGRGTNLPSIHTLQLPGLRRVSDQQPGPSNPFPLLATTSTLPMPLTPSFGEVRGINSPHRSNGVAVEEGWSGYVEASDSVSEPTASTSHYVDGRGTNLPSIHTLRLPGLVRVSDYPADPLDSSPLPATTTSQVPSPQHHIFSVPEQDSPYESQDESSGDSGDMDSEDTQSGGSSPLSSDLDEQGSGLTWRTFGPSEFAHRVPQFR